MDSRDHPSEWVTAAEEIESEGRFNISGELSSLAASVDTGSIPFCRIPEALREIIEKVEGYQDDIDKEADPKEYYWGADV